MIRVFDLLFAVLAVFFFAPFFSIIALYLKVVESSRIFFKQIRVGENFKYFEIIKFTTMIDGSENKGSGLITLEHDKRVLKSGKFFRKYKINELPQLFNVISGNMSLVGPRPLPSSLVEMNKLMFKKSCLVKPGMSGAASLILRNEEDILSKQKDPHSFYIKRILPYKIYLDEWWVENKNLKNYFKIILLTVIGIFNKKINEKNLDKNLKSLEEFGL